MTPDQTFTLAAACAAIDPRYEAFVLIQGFCGLRPGEALELRRRRVDLDGPRPRSRSRAATTPSPTGTFNPARPCNDR